MTLRLNINGRGVEACASRAAVRAYASTLRLYGNARQRMKAARLMRWQLKAQRCASAF